MIIIIFSMLISTPLGTIFCTFQGDTLIGIHLTDEQCTSFITHPLREQINEYFSGKRQVFTLPLTFVQGTPLQQQVWKTLMDIPYGTLVTYSDIAKRAGYPKAIRAVASAVGKNPIPIIIPCHRVIGKQDIWKFGWGKEWKKGLWEREGITFPHLHDGDVHGEISPRSS